jgi:hypothetical protein
VCERERVAVSCGLFKKEKKRETDVHTGGNERIGLVSEMNNNHII